MVIAIYPSMTHSSVISPFFGFLSMIVIELKWDKSAVGAIEQIKEKQYGNALKDYQGNLLLAGINYNRKTKKHECVIETMQK